MTPSKQPTSKRPLLCASMCECRLALCSLCVDQSIFILFQVLLVYNQLEFVTSTKGQIFRSCMKVKQVACSETEASCMG